MNYGEIFSKAWKTIWKHKVLWIFGLLASCGQSGGGGGGGGGRGGGNGANFDFGNMQLPPWLENLGRTFDRAAADGTLWVGLAALIGVVIILGLFLAVIALVLSTIGKAGLVRGTWDVEEGAEKLAFGALFKQSLSYFWKVLGFTILAWLGQLVLGLVAIIPVLLLTLITLGCGLIILIPVIIAAGLFIIALIQLSIVAIVGEGRGVFAALERAWKLITSNLAPAAVFTLILAAGTFLIGLALALPVLLIALPVVLGFIQGGQAVNTGLIVGGGLLLIYILFAVFVSALLHAYLGAAWTLAFRALRTREQGMGEAPPPALPETPAGEEKPEPAAQSPQAAKRPAAATVKIEKEGPEEKAAQAAATVKVSQDELAEKKAEDAGTQRLSPDEIEKAVKKPRSTKKIDLYEDLPTPD